MMPIRLRAAGKDVQVGNEIFFAVHAENSKNQRINHQANVLLDLGIFGSSVLWP
jgi:hypothetical protein